MSEYKHQYWRNGFSIQPIYSKELIQGVTTELEAANVFTYQFKDADSHNLLKSSPTIRDLAYSEQLSVMANNTLETLAKPFHAIILDKTKDDNWGLDWHQDLKIAVRSKIETSGYSGWTEEAGIPHVVPPIHVLQKIAFIRIHLDDCDERNGAIWAIPQSHNQGIIPQNKIPSIVKNGQIFPCCSNAGSVMMMSPLLLHKSPYSLSKRSRRILQIAYRTDLALENGLEWL